MWLSENTKRGRVELKWGVSRGEQDEAIGENRQFCFLMDDNKDELFGQSKVGQNTRLVQLGWLFELVGVRAASLRLRTPV